MDDSGEEPVRSLRQVEFAGNVPASAALEWGGWHAEESAAALLAAALLAAAELTAAATLAAAEPAISLLAESALRAAAKRLRWHNRHHQVADWVNLRHQVGVGFFFRGDQQ